MLTGLRTKNIDRVNIIHEKINQIAPDIDYRIFPIYIRYVKNDSILALLYFNLNEYFELGINTELLKYTGDCLDAEWMKYKEITCSIRINEDTDIEKVFKKIKFK